MSRRKLISIGLVLITLSILGIIYLISRGI